MPKNQPYATVAEWFEKDVWPAFLAFCQQQGFAKVVLYFQNAAHDLHELKISGVGTLPPWIKVIDTMPLFIGAFPEQPDYSQPSLVVSVLGRDTVKRERMTSLIQRSPGMPKHLVAAAKGPGGKQQHTAIVDSILLRQLLLHSSVAPFRAAALAAVL